MIRRIKLLTLLIFVSWINLSASDTISVYIFLHEDCPVSQYYTLQLNELHQEFANENIQFVGLFPNFSSKKDKIEAFKKQYQIPFELKTDYFKTVTKKMGATITPEIVIFDHGSESILYQGRIDDSFFRVGKRKSVTTTSELKDALESIRFGKEIAIKKTRSVGCFINFSDAISK